MKHLVLGGGGFIGSHLCKRLISEGHDVTAVDVSFHDYRESQYQDTYVPYGGRKVEKVSMDLRSRGRCRSVLGANRWDVVWQLAADMGGVEYFHSSADWEAAVNNQIINVNVMNAVAKYSPRSRVVFTSTACALATGVQHHCNYRALNEEDILWGIPDQLYGQEKRNSALLWNASHLDTRVAFLHTVYGPFQEHAGIRMKFPSAVAMKARKARDTGAIELLGDGRQVRTFLYVDDAVDRLLALAASETDPGFVNIGGTRQYTVDEVAKIVCGASGALYRGISINHVTGPTGVENRGCDMSKFYKHFPRHQFDAIVELPEGMKRFIDWLDKIGA